MAHSSLSLAVLLVLMALTAADIPFPPSGKLPFPGGLALLNGAWVASAGSPTLPQYSIFFNNQNAGGRVNADGGLRSSVAEVLSYECLSSDVVRYISKGAFSVDGGEVTTTLACAVAFINATHRVVASYDQSEGKCPDTAALPDAAGGFVLSNDTGLIRFQVYERVDGVLPDVPVLTCKNSTNPLPEPTPAAINDTTLGTEAPADLGAPLGATTPSGLWKAEGTMEIITTRGFIAGVVAGDGSVFNVGGVYSSHRCLSSNTYLASNSQILLFNNGTAQTGYHCEWGQRNGDGLALRFSPGPDCAPLADSNAPLDEELTSVRTIPGIPTECKAIAPGPAPPASSAARAALGGALAALVVLLTI